MSDPAPRPSILAAGIGAGFASAVAMWTFGFFSRLPDALAGVDIIPPPVLFGVFVLLFMAGGAWAVRGGAELVGAALAGSVAGILNLLVLGALVYEPAAGAEAAEVTGGGKAALPSGLGLLGALAGFGLASCVLATLGGWLGGLVWRVRPIDAAGWLGRLALTAVCATFLVVGVGGLVTSGEAGLAVPDWPTSFEYNMFLLPLSRMTGGIYLEHAHRLIGSLVGLTTVTLAIVTFAVDRRRLVKGFTAFLVLAVIVQGIMGGLRVTELSTALAMVHGIFGQIIFALLGVAAVLLSRAWREQEAPRAVEGAIGAQQLSVFLVVALVAQLTLGAALRHAGWGLMLHIIGAMGVLGVAFLTAAQSLAATGRASPQGKASLFLMVLTPLQVLLGFIALAATDFQRGAEGLPSTADLVFATSHQTLGASILLTAAVLATWNRRLTEAELPAEEGQAAQAA